MPAASMSPGGLTIQLPADAGNAGGGFLAEPEDQPTEGDHQCKCRQQLPKGNMVRDEVPYQARKTNRGQDGQGAGKGVSDIDLLTGRRRWHAG